VLVSSSLLAEMPVIKDFYDREHAFVFKSDGSMVELKKLDFPVNESGEFDLEITGKEGGQYLFNGPHGKQYRVFVPEVKTDQAMKILPPCDRPQILLADDHRTASARGVGEDCK